VTLRLAICLIIAICVVQAAQAAVLHIGQRDSVYYNDTVDLRGITGWAGTLAWWATNHDPAQDPPDQYVNITKYERLTIETGMKPGMWYQWYGHNEKAQVAVFFVIPRERPAPGPEEEMTPAPTPTPAPVRIQPEAIADLLVANGDPLTYTTGNCQVWLIGPTMAVMGNTTTGSINLSAIHFLPGTYSMILQYPDAIGVYEVFPEGERYVESAWKGVEGFWYAPMDTGTMKTRLLGMFADTAHFHGTVVEKKVVMGDQHVDITALSQTGRGNAILEGITNLAAGDTITLVWDADRNVEASDLARNTFTTKARGEDPGAYRVWQAGLDVNLSSQAAGYHHVTARTPDGHTTTVEFYVREAFTPAEAPAGTIRYIDNSPFIPVPTPVVIEKEIPVTVIQTVTIPVTPAYETVLEAQQEAARTQRQILEMNILEGTLAAVLLYLMYRGTRYLMGVVRRARVAS
jgi:hypothetical protein